MIPFCLPPREQIIVNRVCLGWQVVKTIERILYANDEAEAKQAMAEAQAQHADRL